MRTVTFSDRAVATFINENFVATWVNRNPKFHNCELDTEAQIERDSCEVFSTRNFATIFMTPEKQVLHYMAGYFSPRWFLPEAEMALEIRQVAFDDEFRPMKDAASVVAKTLESHERRHRDEARLASKGKIEGVPKRAIGSLIEGLQNLEQVHHRTARLWSKGKPLKYESVVTGYSAGSLWLPVTEQ